MLDSDTSWHGLLFTTRPHALWSTSHQAWLFFIYKGLWCCVLLLNLTFLSLRCCCMLISILSRYQIHAFHTFHHRGLDSRDVQRATHCKLLLLLMLPLWGIIFARVTVVMGKFLTRFWHVCCGAWVGPGLSLLVELGYFIVTSEVTRQILVLVMLLLLWSLTCHMRIWTSQTLAIYQWTLLVKLFLLLFRALIALLVFNDTTAY